MRILLFLFLALTLFGRDNPFFPSEPEKERVQTSNKVEVTAPFTTKEILLPNSARVLKTVTLTYQNLDGSIENEEVVVNAKIDWHEPFVLTHKMLNKKQSKQAAKSTTVKTKFINFKMSKKSMHITTKDTLLHNFLLTNPHRIVMDFKRNTSFKPKLFTLNRAPFAKIRMGNHDGYYRVVIELDGQYRYKLETRDKDYTIAVY